MGIILLIFAFILLAAGLLGAVLPGIPGPPLSYAGLLLLQWSGRGGFSSVFLFIWAGITIAVTLMDYFLPSIFAERFGGSRYASVGSFLGLIAGIFLFPPWGMIAGPFLGAFAGEMLHSRKTSDDTDTSRAFKVALGAFLAFIAGSGAKLIASGVMIFYAVRALF